MSVDIRIQGADQLEALAKALKAAGNNELRKELLAGIRAAAKPTVADVKANLGAHLPRRGGFAAIMARSSIGVRTRTSGQNTGVRIQAKHSKHDLVAIDRGILRHPVFGNRDRWVTQTIVPGLVSNPIEDAKPRIRTGVLEAMENTARKITRSV